MIKKYIFCLILVILSVMVLIMGCEQKKDLAVKKDFGKKEIIEKPKEINLEPKKVRLETTMGDIIIELNEEKAPITTANFLRYVEEGFYNGTIFHRVIAGFMIQGGGFTADMNQKNTHTPITNEASNGLKNDRGSIAMARTSNPDSATCQFFINHKNNDFLNFTQGRNDGYAVFGKVVEGMDTVDKIAAVKTAVKMGMDDVPVGTVLIKSATVVPAK